MVLLQIPPRLQYGAGADQFVNDCAVTSAAMILEALRGWRLPIDALARRTKLMYQPGAGLTVSDAKALLELFGVSAERFFYTRPLGLEVLRGCIDAGQPVIVAIKVDRFVLAHAVVLTGYDAGTFTINDPMFSRPLRYSNTAFANMLFFEPNNPAWAVKATGLREGVSNIMAHRTPHFPANVRAFPSTLAKVVGAIKDGDRLSFRPSEIVQDQSIERNHWLRIAPSQWVALKVV